MKTKKEVIQSAWSENWDLLFDSEREHALQNYGWIPNIGLKLINKINFDFKEMHIIFGSPEQWIRPQKLSGLESNNGWIRIESQYDLPNGTMWLSDGKMIWEGAFYIPSSIERINLRATHYQPIIKPLPPLF